MNLEDELTPLATRLAKILDDKKHLTDEEAAIKARIRELVPGPDSYAAGPLHITASANTRFNEAKALAAVQNLDENVRAMVTATTTVIDKKRLEALLPEVYASALDVFEMRIALK